MINFQAALKTMARDWDLDEKRLSWFDARSVRSVASETEDRIHASIARQIETEAGIGVKPYRNAARKRTPKSFDEQTGSCS